MFNNHALGTCTMNRRKKIKDIYDKRMKQANLKVNPKKAKAKYISKAERAKLEAESAAISNGEVENTESQTTEATDDNQA
jgi:hypothetical protein